MSNRKFRKYLIIQYLITLIIPIASAFIFDVNPYIHGFLVEIAGFSAGISGTLLYILSSLLIESDLNKSIIIMICKIITAYPIFTALYLILKRRKWIAYTINIFASLWGVFIGLLWMTVIMQ